MKARRPSSKRGADALPEVLGLAQVRLLGGRAVEGGFDSREEPRAQRGLRPIRTGAGCNGVRFLASLCGAKRLVKILHAGQLEPSIFDPR